MKGIISKTENDPDGWFVVYSFFNEKIDEWDAAAMQLHPDDVRLCTTGKHAVKHGDTVFFEKEMCEDGNYYATLYPPSYI